MCRLQQLLIEPFQYNNVGPILWLLYSNDLEYSDFTSIKDADDITFYKLCKTNTMDQTDTITPVIALKQDCFRKHGMLLNTSMTVIYEHRF